MIKRNNEREESGGRMSGVGAGVGSQEAVEASRSTDGSSARLARCSKSKAGWYATRADTS